MQQEGRVERVAIATAVVLAGFNVEAAKCHDNIDRWVAEHRSRRAVRGRLITGLGFYVKHSVVDTGTDLLDITPRLGLDDHKFLSFIRWAADDRAAFDALPNQVICTDAVE